LLEVICSICGKCHISVTIFTYLHCGTRAWHLVVICSVRTQYRYCAGQKTGCNTGQRTVSPVEVLSVHLEGKLINTCECGNMLSMSKVKFLNAGSKTRLKLWRRDRALV
jgi:hypothetical protein